MTPESIDSPPARQGSPTDVPIGTSSRATRLLGSATLAGVVLLVVLGLFITPRDVVMADSVRILYVHVPSAIAAYLAAIVAAVGSIAYLWKRSEFGDLIAAASAEIALVFVGLTLVTGMLWGKPTWGAYWVWDARLTTTALLFVILLGYVAIRGVPADPHTRSKRAAIVALVALLDIPIVHFSVDWWRSLHQPASISKLDPELDGLMLFTTMLGIVVFSCAYAWLLMHRFRVEYLREQVEGQLLDDALVERRAEAGIGSGSR